MILLIDNYASFTYNLYQHLSALGARVRVRRNDAVTLEEAGRLRPAGIVISPGPGRPEESGISVELIREFAPRIPIFGVCLGHQALAIAFGGKVLAARRPMHGKLSPVRHDGRGVYRGLKNPFSATRYHSLAVDRKSLPACLRVSSAADDGTVMGIRHVRFPAEGVQFHPESVMTDCGKELLDNFLGRCRLGP